MDIELRLAEERLRRGAEAVLKMILIDGHFHADPHPGNVFYLADNRLALLGLPWDRSSSFERGAADAPPYIRRALW